MNFSQILPAKFHPPLRWLGKIDKWLAIRSSREEEEPEIFSKEKIVNPHNYAGKASTFFIDHDKIRATPGYDQHRWFVERLTHDCTGINLVWTDALATCLATGPKVFQPTAEQFDAMQHVEVHVPIADYRQPYPALVVKIPSESRRKLAEEIGGDVNWFPQWVVMHVRPTEEGKQAVTIATTTFGDGKENTFFFQDRPAFASVEDALQTRVLKEEGEDVRAHRYAERTGRACVNLMLMLVHYGWRDAPRPVVKHAPKKKVPHSCVSDFRTVEMTQSVTIRRFVGEHHYYGPTGVELAPHWRSGHWKMQPHGPRNSLRKMIFIHPVLVRSDRVVGDLAETQADYRVR